MKGELLYFNYKYSKCEFMLIYIKFKFMIVLMYNVKCMIFCSNKNFMKNLYVNFMLMIKCSFILVNRFFRLYLDLYFFEKFIYIIVIFYIKIICIKVKLKVIMVIIVRLKNIKLMNNKF